MARAIMLQGTGSDVGKSLLVAGLCRALVQRGLTVRPFKPQNMSNNAAVTADGGEIGRAQALQARACGVPPSVHMNPVLLKPQSDMGAQVVVQGRVIGTAQAGSYQRRKRDFLGAVLDSFTRMKAEADVVVVEGAGSPAEINLRAGDIANMGFAITAGVPVVLVGDIDRGGVIAALVGTHALLSDEERALVRGFIINKFRGDVRLFDGGLTAIAERTGWHSFGVAPWFRDAPRLPAEDAQSLGAAGGGGKGGTALTVAVPMLARISNFDDFDPLAQEPAVRLVMVPPGTPLPADAGLVILPGSKATIADLAFFRAQGWDVDLLAHHRRGGRVLGVCGGYQMLGRRIADPDGIEGPPGAVDGLGLLDVETVLSGPKILEEVRGRHRATGTAVAGYEMHMGRTAGPDTARPLLAFGERMDGAASVDGRVAGCYLHGLFTSDAFRAAWLSGLGASSDLAYDAAVDATLDALADHLERHLDVAALLDAAV